MKTLAKPAWECLMLLAVALVGLEPAMGAEPGLTLRERFADLDLAIKGTAVFQGVDDSGSDESSSDATLSIDLSVLLPLSDFGEVYALIEAGDGEGLDAGIETLSGLNANGGQDSRLELTQLWYRHSFADGLFSLKAGKVDMTCDFDANALANDQTSQFLSPGFANNLAIEFPDSGFGVITWLELNETVSLGAGLADAVADWEEPLDKPFAIGEADISMNIAGRPAIWRVYVWANGQDDPRFDTGAEEGGYGFGLSAEQSLSDCLSAFLRLGSQRRNVYPVSEALSLGFEVAGNAYGREDDLIGIAWGTAFLSSRYEGFLRGEGEDPADEHHLEAYYSLALTDYMKLSPDLQWVINPAGMKNADDIFAFALRAELFF